MGFVSGDLRNHAVAYFIDPVWAAIDRDQLEIWAYHTCGEQDFVTPHLRRLTDAWRQVEAMLLLAAERTEGVLREPGAFVWHLSLGDFCVNYELNAFVAARDVVEVDGRRLPVVVVRSVTDTGGTHPGRRTDVIWWSVPRALPLRWSIDTEIRGIARLRTRAELALETLAPRV